MTTITEMIKGWLPKKKEQILSDVELKAAIGSLPESPCGCSRESARNFFQRASKGKSEIELVDLYLTVGPKLHSYCATGGHSNTHSSSKIS